MNKKVVCIARSCLVCPGTVLLKDNLPEIWHMAEISVVTTADYEGMLQWPWLGSTHWWSQILTRQLTISDSMNNDRVRTRFVATSFFSVAVGAYRRSVYGFLVLATANTLSSVKEMMLPHWTHILAPVLSDWVLHGSSNRLSQLLSIAIFEQ